MRHHLASVASVALLVLPSTVRAGEIQAGLGVASRKSMWRTDFTGGGQLGLGYRFARVLAVDFVGWSEYASVDRRINTGITFGLTGTIPMEKIRPNLRLYFIHQHEEGMVSVADHPFGTALGLGAGIRHRAGAGTRLGVEIPFDKRGKHTEWVANFGLDTTWFPDDSLGPKLYVGVGGGVSFNYSLEDLP